MTARGPDAETAPLLDPTTGAQPSGGQRDDSDSSSSSPFVTRLRHLSTLEKSLAVLSLALLLTAATFVGLFAGTSAHNKHTPPSPPPSKPTTQTVTATRTIHPSPTSSPSPPSPSSSPVCTSRPCVLLASDILHSLDTATDPCSDFYTHANGGWLEAHEIPSDRGSFGTFQALTDENRKVISDVIEGKKSRATDDDEKEEAEARKTNLGMLRTAYGTCMDEAALAKVGDRPVKALVKELEEVAGLVDWRSVATVAAASDGEDEDWTGAYTGSESIPEDLRAYARDVMANERAATAAAPSSWSLKKSLLEPKMAFGSGAIDADVKEIASDALHLDSVTPGHRSSLTSALTFLHSHGIDALLSFAITGDAGSDDPQVQALTFYQTMGGLPAKEYYEEKAVLDLYTGVVKDVLGELAGGAAATAASSSSSSLAKQVVRFERSLWRAGAKPEDLSNPRTSYHPVTFDELEQALAPIGLDLRSYVSSFAPRNFPEKVIVSHLPYLHALDRLLAATPEHVISAYFATRAAMTYSTYLAPSAPIRRATRRLQEALAGIKPGTPEDRKTKCLAWVDDLEGLGLIGGKEFIDRKFGGDSKERAEEVILGIIAAFKRRLQDVPWMDAESARAAEKKADNLLVKVGYPTTPDVSSSVALRTYFSRLEITDASFFDNARRINLRAAAAPWQLLGKRRDRGSWEMPPQLVNAYYSPPDGEIVFPAGILQPPFFSADWPLAAQYGAFGSVAAHELSHAFDNSGSQYDERGRLRNWWTNETVARFERKAQCVARVYSDYAIDGPDGRPVHINGNLTNGEDLGDSGITFAYSAWQEAMKRKGLDVNERLPGLEEYTQEQLFFISSSRVWAQLITPESALARVSTQHMQRTCFEL